MKGTKDMPYNANGYYKQTITLSDSSLSLLQSACVKAILPVDNGKTRLIFSDNRANDIKNLLIQCRGTKIDSLVINVYDYASVLKNTYTYTNVQLVPTDSQISSISNSVINYGVNVVAESVEKTYDW